MTATEKKEALLKSRSEKLAQMQQTEERSKNTIDLLLFTLLGETYGVESIYAQEVFPVKELTPLPSVPNYVSGVIQVRRKVYSLVDLRKFFGFPLKNENNGSKAIILGNNEMAFGLLTEEVVGILSINTDDLQAALPSMQGIYLQFIKGITKDRVVVLDGEKLLKASIS